MSKPGFHVVTSQVTFFFLTSPFLSLDHSSFPFLSFLLSFSFFRHLDLSSFLYYYLVSFAELLDYSPFYLCSVFRPFLSWFFLVFPVPLYKDRSSLLLVSCVFGPCFFFSKNWKNRSFLFFLLEVHVTRCHKEISGSRTTEKHDASHNSRPYTVAKAETNPWCPPSDSIDNSENQQAERHLPRQASSHPSPCQLPGLPQELQEVQRPMSQGVRGVLRGFGVLNVSGGGVRTTKRFKMF